MLTGIDQNKAKKILGRDSPSSNIKILSTNIIEILPIENYFRVHVGESQPWSTLKYK